MPFRTEVGKGVMMFPRILVHSILPRSILFFVGVSALSASVVAQSDLKRHHPTVLQGLKSLQERSRPSLKVTWYQDGQRVRTLDGNLSAPASGLASEAATKFVVGNAGVFRMEPSSDLRVEDVREAGAA